MTEPDIENAVQYALAQTGKPYHAYGARFGPDYFDCSGLVIAALSSAAVPLPSGISVANRTGNTVSLYNWANDVGGLVSVDKAVATRGAILIKGKWYGNGPLGHTSISLGGGQEMAAHGTFSGVHPADIYGGRNYQDGFIIPGVFYAALQPPVDPAVLEALVKLEEWKQRVSDKPLHYLGHRPLDTAILNQLLVARVLLDPKWAHAQVYGKPTAGAVNHLKRLHGIRPLDGKVFGSEAANALLTPPQH